MGDAPDPDELAALIHVESYGASDYDRGEHMAIDGSIFGWHHHSGPHACDWGTTEVIAPGKRTLSGFLASEKNRDAIKLVSPLRYVHQPKRKRSTLTRPDQLVDMLRWR